ncbi:CoB--CoM heterodisulfide reductase iron-sulfur subunit B family protein [Eggerthella sp. YY7918]|uniref:CoB--CoM heterodisulfide reductase iron-sulfur subunit B family protein n=1 Tax=Eggerthella sp. (strain YY7918) TaxID=502558 RepID=UPI00021713BE|nr:CoB--CoM heterodisulfide reductase iron-sulfur subunit B family protein [Eggerthella sp. YY7918]BAK44258.1 heterodisulfide reductase, subunit B [Eggerthella sp. YY7918]
MSKELRYAFFPGCTLESAAGELKIATERTCKKLGIQLEEIKGWTCCGAAQIQDIDDFLGVAINARNIALAEQAGFDRILTVCNTCTLMLRTAKKRLDEDAELRAKVNEALAESGLEYKGTCEITHYLWVLVEDYGLDKLKQQVKAPLTNLNVANFYGCHILMPPEVMGFENPRNPRSMELLAEALGAQNVDFEQRLACCGFHAIYPAEREALLANGVSCLTARDAGADCLVTPCPLCHMALDMWQADAQKRYTADITMPILHVPQLVGLALGFTPQEMAVNRHMVKPTRMLEKKLA